MLIERKYLVRHQILYVLRENERPYDNQESPNIIDLLLSLNEGSEASGYGEGEINDQVDYLNQKKEVNIQWIDGVKYLILLKKGAVSCSDQIYLNKGLSKSSYNNGIVDKQDRFVMPINKNYVVYDKALNILVRNMNFNIKDILPICNGDEALAKLIAYEFESRGLAKITTARAIFNISLVGNGKAQALIQNGGFRAEFEKEFKAAQDEQELRVLQNENLRLQNNLLKSSPMKRYDDITKFLYNLKDGKLFLVMHEDQYGIDHIVDEVIRAGLVEQVKDTYQLTREGFFLTSKGGTYAGFINENYEERHSSSRSTHSNATSSTMDIFISHSNQDIEVAKALINLIRKALNIESSKIRCTSVPGYKLQAGASTDIQLKEEIFSSKVFIGVITNNSVKSMYVTFELGARWSRNMPLLPLICSPDGVSLLKAPLTGINALNATVTEDIYQFVSDLGNYLNKDLEPNYSYLEEVNVLKGVSSAFKNKKKNVPNSGRIS
jgi:hypothetical protein